jgi:hypothetical protein
MRMKFAFALATAASTVFSLAHSQTGPHFEVLPASAMPLSAPPGETEKFNPSHGGAGSVPHIEDATKQAELRRNFAAAQSNAEGTSGNADQSKRPPRAEKSLAKLKIGFTPKKLGNGHHLLAAAPVGMQTDSGWSGVERFILVPDTGKYRLMEMDLTKSGGKFFMASEAVNTDIENSPAGAKSFIDEEGNLVEEVVWVSDGTFHMLTYLPDMVDTGTPGKKQKRATALSALSIAHALRK